MWGPSIVGYGSFLYVSPANPRTRGTWFKTGFSPRKAQLTFYGLKDLPAADAVLPRLGTFTEGAGCVCVKKLEDIDLDVLRELIAIAWSRTDDAVAGCAPPRARPRQRASEPHDPRATGRQGSAYGNSARSGKMSYAPPSRHSLDVYPSRSFG